jgi:proline iminopeptidase
VPTLVTGGEFDEVTPACARQIEQGIPGARLVVFRNASHVAFHEQPGPYLREIDHFLRSV